jgi:hypothetical protein
LRIAQATTLTRLREVQALLRLTERYEAARLERACARALAAGDGRYSTVRGILARGFDHLDPVNLSSFMGALLAFVSWRHQEESARATSYSRSA